MRNFYDREPTKRLSSNPAPFQEGTMLPDAPESLLMVRLRQAELRG